MFWLNSWHSENWTLFRCACGATLTRRYWCAHRYTHSLKAGIVTWSPLCISTKLDVRHVIGTQSPKYKWSYFKGEYWSYFNGHMSMIECSQLPTVYSLALPWANSSQPSVFLIGHWTLLVPKPEQAPKSGICLPSELLLGINWPQRNPFSYQSLLVISPSLSSFLSKDSGYLCLLLL